jgi:hypothetical protein
MAHHHVFTTEPPQPASFWVQYTGVFRYTREAISLVWSTSRRLTVLLAALTVASGLLPAGIAYVGKLIIDSVVAATGSADAGQRALVIQYVAMEAVLVALLVGAQRGWSVCQSLLRALLGHRVNTLVLEKAVTLSLPWMPRPKRRSSTGCGP